MATIIEIQHQALNIALNRLTGHIDNPTPFLTAIGEDGVERVKQRFGTATGPDGTRWQANSRVTLINYIRAKGGFSRKSGKILAKGQVLAMAKRPLQGLSSDLARELYFNASAHSVTIGSVMKYAAMQQFGGTKAQFKNLWGNIPSRQFLPIDASGELYQVEADVILEQLREYLQED